MSGDVVIKGTIVTPFEVFSRGAVVVEDGKVVYVGPEVEHSGHVYDFGDSVVAPGFIDLHVHGGAGFDVMDASPRSMDGVSRYLSAGGVTSFLPTTCTASHENLMEAALAVKEAVDKGTGGAEVQGLHMEGPYLSPLRRGAQNSDHIRLPSIDEIIEVKKEAGGALRMVTLAPEVESALDVAKNLSPGVVLSAGHTDATYEEMDAAIDAGFGHVSHLFNAMRPFHHRDPGVVGAALTDGRITMDLIADGLHIHPAALGLAATAKGSRKTALVSDSVAPAGLSEGEYSFRGQKVILRGGRCLLKSGVLAGSTIRLCDAVRNMVELVGLPLREAVEMASSTPARIIGEADRKGCLKPGVDADLTVLDSDFSVLFTMVGGRIVYGRR